MSRFLQVIFTSLFFILLFPHPVFSDIYMYVDGKGNITYSDTPKTPEYRLYMKTDDGAKGIDERPYGIEWIGKYAETEARARGVEPALVRAIMEVESNYDHEAVSKKGARGIMQLLPSSFPGTKRVDFMDPLKNIEFGIAYLKKLVAKYNGDYTLVLAAYNAGEGSVKKYGGVPPYPETRRYIRKVLTLYRKFRETK